MHQILSGVVDLDHALAACCRLKRASSYCRHGFHAHEQRNRATIYRNPNAADGAASGCGQRVRVRTRLFATDRPSPMKLSADAELILLQRQTFDYFLNEASPVNGW